VRALIALLLALLIGLLLACVHDFFFTPYAAENALLQCQERGYETYDSFEERILSTQAFGVKCSQPSYKQIEYKGNEKLLVITD